MMTATLRLPPSPSLLRTLALAGACGLLLATGSAQAMGGKPQINDDEGIASRIQPVGRVVFADDAAPAAEEAVTETAAAEGTTVAAADKPAAGDARSGEKVYKSVCSVCHATGAAGAPTVGDKAAWQPRLAKGLDGLLKTAISGLNAMPPRGGAKVTDLELARAIVHMANKSGGNLQEPAE